MCSPRYHLTRYRPAAGIPTFLGIPMLYSPHNLSFISWTIPWIGCSPWYGVMGHTGDCIPARQQKGVPDSLDKHAYLKSWHTSIKIFSFYMWNCQNVEWSQKALLSDHVHKIISLSRKRGRKKVWPLCLGFLGRRHTANTTKAMCNVGK